MKTLSSLAFSAGLILLTGCALAKQALPDSRYDELASRWILLSKCGASGQMDLATATQGQQYIKNIVSVHTVDKSRMEAAGQPYVNMVATSSDCNQEAMRVLGVQRQENQQNATIAADQKAWGDSNNNRSKQTYCNKIGDQVLCSTY